MDEIFIPDVWTDESYELFRRSLIENLKDDAYKSFNSRIIPDTPLAHGIRVPYLRKIAAQILKSDVSSYLSVRKPPYHEEVIIEGLVMAGIKCEYPVMLDYMEQFTEKIYNWAINDTVCFTGIKKHLPEFFADCDRFLQSENPWAQRFGLFHLMKFYLNDKYVDGVLKKVDSVHSDFYYVRMMKAWLLAEAFGKQTDKTLRYLQRGSLDAETFAMTIRKLKDSRRVSAADIAKLNA
ncbi:MAG: DNA alkylation repair protein [Clostridia bacterium]|nr:DNA alkylation repair protein [Clostridia bacterium]